MEPLVLLVIIALIIFIFVIYIFKRYKRCPSDKILVVYGKVGKSTSEGGRSAKCIHGGAAFIWPVFQSYQFLDLTPISIIVDLENALSQQNIRVNVPSRFTVGISTEPGIMDNAAERLLGLKMEEVQHLASDIIFGQLRVVIATMDIEEINSDREKFLKNVSGGVEHELVKIGLKLINVNVTDITDESGYIEALGKDAAAKAINDAKKAVAEKERDGSIGEANAHKEQRIQVSSANADAMAGEADAKQKERIAIARSNAQAVEGENNSKIAIANSDAERRESQAEAERKAVAAEKVSTAKALEEAYIAEKEAEISRAHREKATQMANIIIPTEINKQKIEIDAAAMAEQKRIMAKGDADAVFFNMEAEAKGILEILSKQADGFQKLVAAAGTNPKDAVMLMIADKLPELVKTQVEAIKNIKIDKITVWDNLSGGDGKTPSTSKFISGLLTSIPPFEELFKMAGMELPDFLKGKKSPQDAAAEDVEAEDVTGENIDEPPIG